MATASYNTVAEVEEIVPIGSLDPDCIHVPSIFIQRLVLGAPNEKKIEFRTTRAREAA
jgi:acyl CoA:acetate/3-ketoacid CoA transferase alpha subunit